MLSRTVIMDPLAEMPLDCYNEIAARLKPVNRYMLRLTSRFHRARFGRGSYLPKDLFVKELIETDSVALLDEAYRLGYYNLDESVWSYSIEKALRYIGDGSSYECTKWLVDLFSELIPYHHRLREAADVLLTHSAYHFDETRDVEKFRFIHRFRVLHDSKALENLTFIQKLTFDHRCVARPVVKPSREWSAYAKLAQTVRGPDHRNESSVYKWCGEFGEIPTWIERKYKITLNQKRETFRDIVALNPSFALQLLQKEFLKRGSMSDDNLSRLLRHCVLIAVYSGQFQICDAIIDCAAIPLHFNLDGTMMLWSSNNLTMEAVKWLEKKGIKHEGSDVRLSCSLTSKSQLEALRLEYLDNDRGPLHISRESLLHLCLDPDLPPNILTLILKKERHAQALKLLLDGVGDEDNWRLTDRFLARIPYLKTLVGDDFLSSE